MSNNQAEYEDLVLRLQWALESGIEAIKVISDSQVIIGQVNCYGYSINSDNLKLYTKKVDRLVAQLQYFALMKIYQSLNEVEEKLAKV